MSKTPNVIRTERRRVLEPDYPSPVRAVGDSAGGSHASEPVRARSSSRPGGRAPLLPRAQSRSPRRRRPDPSDIRSSTTRSSTTSCCTINDKDWESLKDQLPRQHVLSRAISSGATRPSATVGIRSRGTGSRSGVKPGLRVDFDRYTTDQKFLGLKSVILRNNTQDPSNMHERLSMLFFRRMGLKAEREAHARLFVNNAYAGLYTIVESVDKTFLTKNFGEDDGHLYEYDFDNASRHVPFYFGYLGTRRRRCTCRCRSSRRRTKPIRRARCIERLFWTINQRERRGRGGTSIAEFLDLKQVHPAPRDRDLPRRRGRHHRRLRPEQLLFLPLREQEPVQVHSVGQEQDVLGGAESRLLHPPQHRGRSRRSSEPAGEAGAEVSGSAGRCSSTRWWNAPNSASAGATTGANPSSLAGSRRKSSASTLQIREAALADTRDLHERCSSSRRSRISRRSPRDAATPSKRRSPPTAPAVRCRNF